MMYLARYLILMMLTSTKPLFSFSGSFDISVVQPIFSDSRLDQQNGFSRWGSLQFEANAGLFEFSNFFEPIVGFGYLRKKSGLNAVDDNGVEILDAQDQPIPSSVDRLEAEFATVFLGIRGRAWGADFFRLIPYGELTHGIRFGRLKKVTYAENQKRSLSGVEGGLFMGGGLYWAFLAGSDKGSDLNELWGLGTLGLFVKFHSSVGGLWRRGFGKVNTVGGMNFGAGLRADW